MSKPKITTAPLGTKHAEPAPATKPLPITRASINRMDDGYTVIASNTYGTTRTSAHTTLAGALAELTRVISGSGKTAKRDATNSAA